jgi:uncharacterized membrane protein (DUF373 family)
LYLLIRKYKQVMVSILMFMMGIILILTVVDLGWTIYRDIFSPPLLLMNVDELLDIFGLFLLVIIGLELMDSMTSIYIHQNGQQYKVVLLVALIAIARKVIILDIKNIDVFAMIGIAAIILALTTGYFLIKKSDDSADSNQIK